MKGYLMGTSPLVFIMTPAWPLLMAAFCKAGGGGGERESTAAYWLQSTKLLKEPEYEAWPLTPSHDFSTIRHCKLFNFSGKLLPTLDCPLPAVPQSCNRKRP